MKMLVNTLTGQPNLSMAVNGMSWGDAKNELYELLDGHLLEPRLKYDELISNPLFLDHVLNEGAERARGIASSNLVQIKKVIGLGKLS